MLKLNTKNHKKKKKGQVMTEWILLIVAVVVILVALLSNGGYLQNQINATYRTAGDAMLNAANRVRVGL